MLYEINPIQVIHPIPLNISPGVILPFLSTMTGKNPWKMTKIYYDDLPGILVPLFVAPCLHFLPKPHNFDVTIVNTYIS